MNFTSITSTRFWRRLGQHNAIGLPLMALSIVFIALLSFTFDAVRLQNLTPLWIPANALSIGLVLAVGIPVLAYKRRINVNKDRQPVFNIVFMSVCFAAKNVSMLNIAPLFGIVDEGIPAIRFIGGLTLGMSVLILYTNIAGSRLERESSMAKLKETETELRAFREAAFDQLEEENQIAATKTINALAPQLEELQKSVKQSEDIVSLASKMANFIKHELRPFSSELSQDAITLGSNQSLASELQVKEPEAKLNLSSSIRLGISFLPIPFLSYFVAAFAIPSATPVDIALFSLVFLMALALIKLAVRKVPNLDQRSSFIGVTVLAVIASLPSFYLISQIPNLNGVPELLPVFYILPGWSILASTQAYILDQKQSRIEYRLSAVVEELARENKLYEQKAWLARHGWYLLLHGVVQPAITTAAIRASNSKEITPEIKDQILTDLQRALDSLTQIKPPSQTLEFNISEVQSVWRGICEIQVEVEDDVFRRAADSAILNQVINEILKEVVSNAVRHGNASHVDIQISLDGSEDIQVFAVNDGSRPVKDRVESVGSRMLEAICLERSLLWNSTTKKTEFKALIPIK